VPVRFVATDIKDGWHLCHLIAGHHTLARLPKGKSASGALREHFPERKVATFLADTFKSAFPGLASKLRCADSVQSTSHYMVSCVKVTPEDVNVKSAGLRSLGEGVLVATTKVPPVCRRHRRRSQPVGCLGAVTCQQQRHGTHLPILPGRPRAGWFAGLDESQGRLLRQRHHGKLLKRP
jgi:hypothetical protein